VNGYETNDDAARASEAHGESDAEAPSAEHAPRRALPGAAPVQRVRKAYEQVYDQLRELIMSGELARGERLPNEVILARDFGVSRGTVREALRVLAAQSLIRTAKGAGGGSFVTLPTVDHISEFLQANIGLLSESEDVSLEEFLEARELLEVFAARRAAARRKPGDLKRMRDTIVVDPSGLSTEERFFYNKEFHSAVLDASYNTLLCIAAQPIFCVLQTNLSRSTLGAGFPSRVNDDHREILEAIEAGDPDLAAEQMRVHMVFLRDIYVGIWQNPKTRHRE